MAKQGGLALETGDDQTRFRNLKLRARNLGRLIRLGNGKRQVLLFHLPLSIGDLALLCASKESAGKEITQASQDGSNWSGQLVDNEVIVRNRVYEACAFAVEDGVRELIEGLVVLKSYISIVSIQLGERYALL